MSSVRSKPIALLIADDDADDRVLAKDALMESRLANPLYFVEDGEELLDFLNRRGVYAEQLFFEYREAENAKQRQEDRVKVVLGDDPTYSLDKPRTTTNVAAGLVLGAMLGMLIVAGLEWTQSSIVRSGSDVERALSLPLLAAVPAEK